MDRPLSAGVAKGNRGEVFQYVNLHAQHRTLFTRVAVFQKPGSVRNQRSVCDLHGVQTDHETRAFEVEIRRQTGENGALPCLHAY